MDLQQGMFAVKLCEMEEAYGRLLSRLRLCQRKNPEQLGELLAQLRDECRENGILLEQAARAGRLPFMASLAQAQLNFWQQSEHLLHQQLEPDADETDTPAQEERAERAALYAEFAIDFAIHTMQYALTSAIQAIVLAQRADQNNKGESTDE